VLRLHKYMYIFCQQWYIFSKICTILLRNFLSADNPIMHNISFLKSKYRCSQRHKYFNTSIASFYVIVT